MAFRAASGGRIWHARSLQKRVRKILHTDKMNQPVPPPTLTSEAGDLAALSLPRSPSWPLPVPWLRSRLSRSPLRPAGDGQVRIAVMPSRSSNEAPPPSPLTRPPAAPRAPGGRHLRSAADGRIPHSPLALTTREALPHV